MLAHDDQAIQKIAVSIVKRIHHNPSPATNQQQVREFRPPLIKESSVSLTDLPPPDTKCTFEPSLKIDISDAELDKIIDEQFATNIPCHSISLRFRLVAPLHPRQQNLETDPSRGGISALWNTLPEEITRETTQDRVAAHKLPAKT